MSHPFRISALPLTSVAPWLAMTDEDLATRGARRLVADSKPGFPCRVSLVDAEIGESLILLPYVHQPSGTHRASGPIFVREQARQATPEVGQVPELLRGRLLSVRAYDEEGSLVDAEIVEGRALERQIEGFFADERVSYLHLHNARPGCYNCRVDRA